MFQVFINTSSFPRNRVVLCCANYSSLLSSKQLDLRGREPVILKVEKDVDLGTSTGKDADDLSDKWVTGTSFRVWTMHDRA